MQNYAKGEKVRAFPCFLVLIYITAFFRQTKQQLKPSVCLMGTKKKLMQYDFTRWLTQIEFFSGKSIYILSQSKHRDSNKWTLSRNSI